MDFDKKLKQEIDNINVPDELLPENIAQMLKSAAPQRSEQIVMSSKRPSSKRTVLMRSLAAVAACAALGAGFLVYTDMINVPAELDSEIEYGDVRQPSSYDDLYSIYTQIYNSADKTAEAETDSTDKYSVGSADSQSLASASQADTVKSEDGTVYFVSGGRIYSITNSGAEFCADIGDKQPIEMYMTNDKLVLISEDRQEASVDTSYSINTSSVPADDAFTPQGDTSFSDSASQTAAASDSASYSLSVTADIYGVSDGSAEHLGSYRQSGGYVSSRISDGNLCIVTNFSSSGQLSGTESDLDEYVPCYETDGEKFHVAASDITVPANANSTDYTVVSAVNVETRSASVKALLGSSKKVCCPNDILYIAGVGKTDSGRPYTIVTSFRIGNSIEYIASGSVDGALSGKLPMNEYDGMLRIATRGTASDGESCINIFVLDSEMKAVNSAGQLLSGENVTSVSFSDRYASLYVENSAAPALILDLSSDPPVTAKDMLSSGVDSLYEYSEGRMAGFGTERDGSGKIISFVLTMFDSDKCIKLDAAEFALEPNAEKLYSPVLDSRRSLLIDSENGLIGVPVSVTDNGTTACYYYVFSYSDESGFVPAGKIKYNGTAESDSFRRAVISGGTLYIISDERIVLTDISDMSVKKIFKIK